MIDFLSGRYDQIERGPRHLHEGGGGRPGFRSCGSLSRPAGLGPVAVRTTADLGSTVGTADLIGVATEGTDANAQVFQVRDGILAERQPFTSRIRPSEGSTRSPPSSSSSTYGPSPAVPKRVVLGPYMSEKLAEVETFLAGRRANRATEVRIAERGDTRRLREMAERNAKLALDQDRLQSEHRQQRRIEALSQLGDALGHG